ncbi:DEAD/DEAH box helicase [Actinoplanes sp. NPDC049802]|uniref:DEAD/DEAH box helicase n=1 Tax=Actinoplanes sp. NPDC049802 TaxID=3154742 RepID=UPI0033C3160B
MLAIARVLWPNITAIRLRALTGKALASGLIRDDDGLLSAVITDPKSDSARPGESRRPGPLRAVIVDVESVVYVDADHPHGDRRIYQLGAVRLSADTEWVADRPRFDAWLRLPDANWEHRLRSANVRERYTAAAGDPGQALTELRDYLANADVLIAYNGVGADFPMLDEAADRAGQPRFGGLRRVDALYLAYAVWPHATSHRLAELAADIGVPAEGLSWHDAADDAELTSRLLLQAATVMASWDPDLRALVQAAGTGSPGWELLASLLPVGTPPPAVPDDALVAQTLADVLAAVDTGGGFQPVRRGLPAATVQVPLSIRDDAGGVDPHALAEAAAHGAVERRPAQQDMARLLTRQLAAGRDVLCEAPTGTGKSFAVLAAALHWLDGDPRRRAVIATYTKALQSQLAGDIDRLADVVPGLLAATDLVKGATNRLSLRSLVTALTDAAQAATSRRPSRRGSTRAGFSEHPGFREVLIYLVRRLVTATTAPQSWLARSTDPVDMPIFLGEYVQGMWGPLLGVWLRGVSQDADDYPLGSATPLTEMTDSVGEALAGHRLVIANHALLMSRADVFTDDTLLVVDEAHALEQAATGAASAEIEYRLVENMAADLRRWANENSGPPGLTTLVRELEEQLDTEVLPKAAQAVFDRAGGAPGARSATLASPFGGLGGDAPARQMLTRLDALARLASAIHSRLAGYLNTQEARGWPWWDRERLRSLASRIAALADAAGQIVSDARDVLDPNARQQDGGGVAPDAENRGEDDGAGSELDGGSSAAAEELSDPVSAEEEDLADDEAVRPQVVAPEAPDFSNRVVYAIEHDLSGLTESARRYAFTAASAPIELAREPQWQAARARFAHVFYVSATLRIADGWDYIRGRLGLGTEVDAVALNGPFDLATQARLVCFSDFPSWAEQENGAVRTVAHQLAGYAREIVRPAAPDDNALRDHYDPGGQGWTGGALVLTTATRAAAAITDRLQRELPTAAPGVPIAAAPLLGNARAARMFTGTGGFCVATRGMWQGVDFPADRLSLVWINKLPFAPFADPVVAARRAAVARRAADAGHPDPDRVATEDYYLPLAAMDLRQAVGRLIRSRRHRGVIVISDRKLAGRTALRRSYRKVFLESLDQGLLIADPGTGEPAGGNVTTMADGWERIWRFLADAGRLGPERAGQLCDPAALEEHTLLPATRMIRRARLTTAEEAAARADGTLADLLVERCERIAGHLRFSDDPLPLKPQQRQVIRAVAEDRDALALLPTGFGKSYTFQLPALALPGVTVVISPLIALMADQALELNASIGGAVRALVGPMTESNSWRGKTEVAEQLTGAGSHDIALVYVSPERLGNRRFQEWLRAAAQAGILRRVAVDEAHTFVQWGDDFRPSFRRAAQLLAELRTRYGVRVTAVTATANRSVRRGLRGGLFALPAEPEPGEELVTVAADPLRPELAIYRRALAKAGPNAVAGLTEAVTAACDDHAIFYCLTVKEVDALYAHLREFAGDTNRRVRRFHGRLSEAEKSAVLTEFREAAAKGDDGFAPLLIVATSAFGLGVNRGDIRCVFVVSPPTDLAALYQQLGRAGRDQAGRAAGGITAASYGLALGTGRGLRTVAWMAAQGLGPVTLRAIGQAVLAAGRRTGVLDPDHVTDDCIAADLAAGRLSRDDARKTATVSQYRSVVIRALAVLADAGVVDDGGDFPATVILTPIEEPAEVGEHTLAATAAAIIALAAASPGRHRITELHRRLGDAVPGYRLLADDPAQTWAVLAALHDLGVTDVSQAGNNRTLVAVRPRHAGGPLPEDFLLTMTGNRARRLADLRELRDWYDSTACANEGFAGYFAVSATVELPEGTCTTTACRCSSCWAASTIAEPQPALLTAFNTPRPRPSARRDAEPYRQALQRYVRALLWDNYRGLTATMIHRVLRGDETYLSAATGRRRPLWPGLLYHRLRGVDPGIRLHHVEQSLQALTEQGNVVADGRVWRLRRHADRDATRAAAHQAASPGAGQAAAV